MYNCRYIMGGGKENCVLRDTHNKYEITITMTLVLCVVGTGNIMRKLFFYHYIRSNTEVYRLILPAETEAEAVKLHFKYIVLLHSITLEYCHYLVL